MFSTETDNRSNAAPSAERRAPSAERRALAWLCAVLGAVLLVAAGLKGHSLLTDFVPGKTYLLSRFMQFITVELELALGLWLVSGLALLWAARVAMAFFLALAGASGWLLASGAECCGCLGRMAVSPWFSFAFNLIAVCALALTPRPRSDEPEPPRPNLALGLSGAWVFLGLFLLVAGWKEPIQAGRSRTLGSLGDLVVLDVENWSGQRLPVLEHIDIGKRIGRGGWTVIFHHRDCPKCEALIQAAARRARSGEAIALVEVPALSGDGETLAPRRDRAFAASRLAASRRWVVDTPQVLRVEDGVVVRVGDGLDGERSEKPKKEE
ncbi:MAG: hypothetical protein K2W96_24815 [Gemmataceae bacterium]|nr:hypothetical protein [Gemmataceae bacterium]